jgi:hypothetical protein
LRLHAEWPLLSRIAVRTEAGRVSWRYDHFGPRHQPREDVVSVTRLTLTVFFFTPPDRAVRGYIGGGIGAYHWTARVGTTVPAWRRGGHAAMGIGVPVGSGRWAIAAEVQVHVMSTPHGRGSAHPYEPTSGSAVLSLTHSIGVRLRL